MLSGEWLQGVERGQHEWEEEICRQRANLSNCRQRANNQIIIIIIRLRKSAGRLMQAVSILLVCYQLWEPSTYREGF